MGNTISNKVFEGTIWRFLERISAQLVTFVVSIVLGRILDPDHYGVIAMVTVFITFMNSFVSDGLGTALIRSNNTTDDDFTSVFYFNIVFSVFIYFMIFILSPLIESFFAIDMLSPVLRVMCLRIPIAAVNSIQHAYISKNLLFKKFFLATLLGTAVSGVVGILLAIHGYGVWALVAQYLTNTTIDTIVLWFTIKWRPRGKIRFSCVKKLLPFGLSILGQAQIKNLSNEIRSLLIGKVYSPSDLAFYNRGKNFPDLVNANINSAINSVLFPAYAHMQCDKERMKAALIRSIKIGSFFMSPLLIGLATVSSPLISVLLTDKWLPSVPYIRILCLQTIFWPISGPLFQIIKSTDSGKFVIISEFIVRGFGLLILLISVRLGVIYIAWSAVFTTLFAIIVYYYYVYRKLNFRIKELLSAFVKPLVCSLFMGGIVYLLSYLRLPALYLLIIQIIVGAIIYFFLSAIFIRDSFDYTVRLIQNLRRK